MELIKIKPREFPSDNFVLIPCDEPFVDLEAFMDEKIKVDMAYYQQGINGAVKTAYLRQGAAERLKKAASLLPAGYQFLIYDAWRPISVQQALFDDYYHQIKNNPKHKNLSADEITGIVKKFVSVPSYDENAPSVHNTGGAVDLTIVDENGKPLDMGTGFDDFSPLAHTDYFEDSDHTEVRDNRRLLYTCMTKAGFTNLPSEWWHYDYADRFWSYYTGKPAKYKGFIEGNVPIK